MTFPTGSNGFSSNRGDEGASSSQDAERTQVFAPIQDSNANPSDFFEDVPTPPQKTVKKRHVWPWILVAVIVLIAAVCAGMIAFFNNRALPGTTLWGNNVTGKTQQQIAQTISDDVSNTKVKVSYNGKTDSVTLADLGIKVDANAIAQEAVNAKRQDNVFARYAFWNKQDVTPNIDVKTASSSTLDQKLSTNSQQPTDAKLQMSQDGTTIEVVEAQEGNGADPTAVASEAVKAVESLGSYQPKEVAVQIKNIDPAITTDDANAAKATLDKLMQQNPGVYIGSERFAAFTPAMILSAAHIDTDTKSSLPEGQSRNGNVVFDAAALQKIYDEQIKPNLKSTKEDREVIVNNSDKKIKVIKEGHDGVTLDNGADSNIGTQAISAFSANKGNVEVSGKLDPMKVKKTKRHVVVDLSDHKVYAYENDKLIKSMSMSAGQGNDFTTGKCQASGDLCTPEGDFEVWLKYDSQDMSGTLTLSNGQKEKWDVKDVGFVNYFSKTGCAIHRIATGTSFSDAQIAAMAKNTSHGCVGIGWDVAEWFYNWCVMGTSVHVQE